MGTFPQGDEELRTIGIGTSIRHAEQGFRVQRPGEVFVREHASVYRFAAGAIALGEVCWMSDVPIFDGEILHASSLDHEILNAPVQNAVFVVERHAGRRDALFSST